MSANINNVTLIGHLGSNPERVQTRSGAPMVKLNIATNIRSGDYERTDWHTVVCYDRVAEQVLERNHKGDLVYVDGRIEYTRVASDGGTKYYTDIRAWRVSTLTRSQRSHEPVAAAAAAPTDPADAMRDGFAEETIPF